MEDMDRMNVKEREALLKELKITREQYNLARFMSRTLSVCYSGKKLCGCGEKATLRLIEKNELVCRECCGNRAEWNTVMQATVLKSVNDGFNKVFGDVKE